MKHKIILASFLFLYSSTSYAVFCPSSFNIVREGDTIEKVIAACGEPISKKVTRDTSMQPQSWSFYPNTSRTQGTLKMNVGLEGGVVQNISINNISLRTTNVCGSPISVGDKIDTLKNACGNPASNTFSDNPQGVQYGTAADLITELRYQGNTAVTFVFKNGKLTQTKQ